MKKIYQIWGLSLVFNLILSYFLPLFFDETYYWVWSHNLQLSYYDHPPFVAWLYWLGHFLEPYGNTVRWPAIVFAHLTILIWLQILKPWLSKIQLEKFVWLYLMFPMLGLGAIVITPDIPLVFFWSLAILFFWRVENKQQPLDYIGLGIALGLGGSSKYHIVLFLIVTTVYLVVEKKWRMIQWKYVPLTILMGLIFCAPVLIWNYQNDFVSILFQLNHGFVKKAWRSAWTLEYIISQILIIFPAVLWFAFRRRSRNMLFYFAAVPLAFFLLSSFKAPVEANWPIVAYPAILALFVMNVRSQQLVKTLLIFWFIAKIVVLTDAFFPYLPVNRADWKTSEFTEYDPLLPYAAKANFFASEFQMASSLSYKLKKPIYKLAGMHRPDFYDFLPVAVPQSDQFVVARTPAKKLPSRIHAQDVIKTEKVAPYYILETIRNNEELKAYHFR